MNKYGWNREVKLTEGEKRIFGGDCRSGCMEN